MNWTLLVTLLVCVVSAAHGEYVSEEDTCECVPLRECLTPVVTVDIGGTTGGCSHYLDTCCTQLKPKVAISARFRNSPGAWTVENRPKPPPPTRLRFGCGQRNPGGAADFRITNNKAGQTQFGEWPWMVAVVTLQENIVTNKTDSLEYHCGGSLIHTKVVLTAAHCVNSYKTQPRQLKVLLGEWDTQTENEELPVQEKKVESLVLHEQYDGNTLINDVALLFLHGQAKIADNVDTVCLPKVSPPPVVGTACFVTGWGKDKFGKDGLYQVILKNVMLPLVSHSACQKALQTTRLSKFFKLHESFRCAGGERGIDTCKGDGGGPLVCPVPGHDGHFEQVGIVSWGIGCGEAGIPGVYADVATLRPWIDSKMAAAGFTADLYSWGSEEVVQGEEEEEWRIGGFDTVP